MRAFCYSFQIVTAISAYKTVSISVLNTALDGEIHERSIEQD